SLVICLRGEHRVGTTAAYAHDRVVRACARWRFISRIVILHAFRCDVREGEGTGFDLPAYVCLVLIFDAPTGEIVRRAWGSNLGERVDPWRRVGRLKRITDAGSRGRGEAGTGQRADLDGVAVAVDEFLNRGVAN